MLAPVRGLTILIPRRTNCKAIGLRGVTQVEVLGDVSVVASFDRTAPMTTATRGSARAESISLDTLRTSSRLLAEGRLDGMQDEAADINGVLSTDVTAEF